MPKYEKGSYEAEDEEEKKKADDASSDSSYQMQRGYEETPEESKDGQNLIPEDEMAAIKMAMKLKRFGGAY